MKKEFDKSVFIGQPYFIAETIAKELGFRNVRFIMGHYKMDYDETRINFHLNEDSRVSNAWIG